MCVIVYHNRQKKFEGVSKSPVVDYNEKKQRVHYLSIGRPPRGENEGNTAANTHKVLQILKTAMKEKGNHGDGGWASALLVSICCVDHGFVVVIVVVCLTMTLNFYPTLHTQYLRKRSRALTAFRRLLGRPILKRIKFQDVVFASSRGECVDALGAAERACASNTSELGTSERH